MRTRFWLLVLAAGLGLGALVAAPAAEAPKVDAERIAKLVKQLGSDSFDEREKASKELEAIGAPALEALRKAAKEGEAEVKTRAEVIVQKAEKKALAEKLLAPTKVKLVFKDTPLADAIAEFNKKSGYEIQLHDPDKKLKDRKVTLDTGEVTFWEAFDKFCEKAGLAEATWQDLMPKVVPGGPPGGGILPPPPGGPPTPVSPIKVRPLPPEKNDSTPAAPPAEKKAAPAEKKEDAGKGAAAAVAVATAVAQAAAGAPAQAGAATPAQAGGGGGPVAGAAPAIAVRPGFGWGGMDAKVITVVDGKPKAVPTCYSGSVRIRALKEGPNFGIGIPLPPGGKAKEDDHTVWLELRAEPKVQIQMIQSVAVEKATDDQDQKLGQVAPAAAPGGGPGVVPGGLPGAPGAFPAAPPGGGIAPIGRPFPFPGSIPGIGGTQYYAVHLKKGEKEAKALKEFAGAVNAQVVPPAEPLITADKITKAAGETFKGKDGGQIKVTEVKEEDGKITVKFELEQPDKVVPANVGGPIGLPPGVGGPGGIPIKGVPVPLAPAPAPLPPAKGPAAPGGAGFAFQAGGAAAPGVQIQIQIAPAGGGVAGPGIAFPPFGGIFPAQGVTLVDDKGKTIPQTGGAPPKFQFVPGGGMPKAEYTQEYKLEKDQKPAKLVFSGSKMVTIDIPFSFKDVPLK